MDELMLLRKARPSNGPDSAAFTYARARLDTLIYADAEAKARAATRRPPSKRLIVMLAVFAALVFAFSAVATDGPGDDISYWYDITDRSARAEAGVQEVTLGQWQAGTIHGEASGYGWSLRPYVTEGAPNAPNGTLGIEFGTDLPKYEGSNEAQASDQTWGYPVYGLAKGPNLHWIGWGAYIPGTIGSGGGDPPKYVYGPANSRVMSIDLVADEKYVVTVRTFAGPPGVRARFWVAVLPLGHLVHTLVPRDRNGNALERWRLRSPM